MAVINVTSGNQAVLTLGNDGTMAAPGGADGLIVPTVQDITVSASTGTTRYSTLDSSASSAFTTVNENSISLNMLVDGETFFGDGANANNTIANKGLMQTSKEKTEIFFSVAFNEGNSTGEYYISGKGFLTGLTPTASIDQAVWISPMEIVVNGELSRTVVA
jgi:hypothetical protein